MSTLITGGGGVVGRLTADLLAARGDAVVLADVREIDGPHRSVACDVTDAASLDAAVAAHGVTRIVHLAALLSTAIRADPVAGVRVNVVGTANVLECARRHGVARVVCASSTTVGYTAFGRHDATPVEEDVPLHVLSERPASIYAMTKIAGEHLAWLYHDLYGVDAVALRYGAVLGGGDAAPSSVPGRLLARLAGAGRSGVRLVLDDPFLVWGGREEFVDARDCAQANVCALDAAAPVQRVYNVAPGTWFSLEEFVDIVRGVFPRLDVTLPPPSATGFAGFPHLRPAPSATAAAAAELGFRCAHTLADTIRHWTVAS